MAYIDFTTDVSWASIRVNYEESYNTESNTITLTITSIQVKNTKYTNAYYLDGYLKVNGQTVLSATSTTGNVKVDVNATNKWYTLVKDGTQFTTTIQISHDVEGSEVAIIELAGNRFQTFSFYTVEEGIDSNWGVVNDKSKNITLTVEKSESSKKALDYNSLLIGYIIGRSLRNYSASELAP